MAQPGTGLSGEPLHLQLELVAFSVILQMFYKSEMVSCRTASSSSVPSVSDSCVLSFVCSEISHLWKNGWQEMTKTEWWR